MSYRTTTLALVCGFFLANSAFSGEVEFDKDYPRNGGGKIHVKGTFKLDKTDTEPSVNVEVFDSTGTGTSYPVTMIDAKKGTFEFKVEVPPGTYGVRLKLEWKNKENKIRKDYNPAKGAVPPAIEVEIKK